MPNKNDTKLLPCPVPWCNGIGEWAAAWTPRSLFRKPFKGLVAAHRIECPHCGIRTPAKKSKESATETWNNRHEYAKADPILKFLHKKVIKLKNELRKLKEI